MLNDSPKKSWRASGITSQSLSVHIGPQSSALAIFAVNNVLTMIGSPVDPDAYAFYDGVTGYDGVELYQSPSTTLPIDWDFTESQAHWEDFTSQDGFELLITITPKPGAFAEIGIITSGDSLKYTEINPSPGMEHGQRNYSIVKELSNGGFYVKNRDIVDTFSGSAIFDKVSFEEFRKAVKTEIKSSPTAWYIMTKGEDIAFLSYARLESEPTGSRLDPSNVSVSFNLIEQV